MTVPCILTIAGSDSGGGAGIQADLKTFAAFGCFGTSVITAITAQNTQSVFDVASVSPDMIQKQLDAVFDDFPILAVKVGMLWDRRAIDVVIRKLENFAHLPIVVDPVMAAKGGSLLLQKDALEELEHLFSIATLITPNLIEASALLGRSIESSDDMEEAAIELLEFGSDGVLLKGGHLETNPGADCLALQEGVSWYETPKVLTKNTHGTGCTYSAAIAALLGLDEPLEDAVGKAKEYLHHCLEEAKDWEIGSGIGPLCHFPQHWQCHDLR